MEITKEHAIKFLELCDAGLSKGLGQQAPGQMCVEACWNAALGLPHGDDPCGVVIGSKAIPEGAVVKIREKADKWDELRKNLDFYESGVDENGNGIEDKNLKDLLVRTVEKVVFAHWETTPRK